MSQNGTSTTPKSISCDDCRELLSDYVDRELTESEKASVENHLKTCLKCTTESTRLSGLKKVVQHWEGVKGSGTFHQAVMQQMIRESQQMPAAPFKAAAAQSGPQAVQPGAGGGAKSISPLWVLLGAALCAVVTYFVVLKLRGM